MAEITERQQPMVHVRFEGRSWDIPAGALDLVDLTNDGEIVQALARHLDVAPARFASYVVERHQTGNVTVRPQAVFG
jgi:hypothetical protein